MRKKHIIIIVICFCLIGCCLFIPIINSPLVNDLHFIYDRDSESNLAVAFVVALRTNHSEAYKMIDPSMKHRLDEWMETHESQKCSRMPHNILSGSGSENGYVVYFDCFNESKKWYNLTVDNIVIVDMRIVNWGEITEEEN